MRIDATSLSADWEIGKIDAKAEISSSHEAMALKILDQIFMDTLGKDVDIFIDVVIGSEVMEKLVVVPSKNVQLV